MNTCAPTNKKNVLADIGGDVEETPIWVTARRPRFLVRIALLQVLVAAGCGSVHRRIAVLARRDVPPIFFCRIRFIRADDLQVSEHECVSLFVLCCVMGEGEREREREYERVKMR